MLHFRRKFSSGITALTFIGTPIDGVGGGSFGVTGRGRMGGSLTMDKCGSRAEAVLSTAEGVECDTD